MIRDLYLGFVSSLMQTLPQSLRGRWRLARVLLRLAGESEATVRGARGLRYCVPSLREPIALGIVADGHYEPQTLQAILEHMPPDGVFVDVGANIGAIVIPVASALPNARVIALEASEVVSSILRKNVRMNSLTNVEVHEALVGSRDGQVVRFNHAPKDKFGMGSMGTALGGVTSMLEVTTLDTLLKSIDATSAAVIKLDIEGAEVLALEGSTALLQRKGPSPVIIFEFNDWSEENMGVPSGAAQYFLLQLGYRIASLNDSAGSMTAPMCNGSAMLIAKRASE